MTRSFLLFVLLTGMLLLPVSLVAQTDDSQPVTIHVVQRGENLFRIALSYGLTTEQLAKANGIANPENILVGQRLVIPVNGAVEMSVPADDPIASDRLSTDAGASFTHTVQSGETLFRIATQYGLSTEELQQANTIADPTLIYAGQTLIIPGIIPPERPPDLPEIIANFSIKPPILAEGKTSSILIVTGTASTVTGTLVGQSLLISSDPEQINHTGIIGIPIYTPAGTYPLDLTVTSSGGLESFSVDVQIISGGYGSQYITLPPDRIELLSPAMDENEINLIASITTGFRPDRFFEGGLSLPAAAAMNSPFGTRRAYNGGEFDRYHNGADFAGAPGSPVLAAAAGYVVLADNLNIRGTSIIIDHGWGVYTNYSHLSERYVQLGDFVTSGQTIGTVGSSGRATGAHLHWEVWVNGVAVDPMQWVRESFP